MSLHKMSISGSLSLAGILSASLAFETQQAQESENMKSIANGSYYREHWCGKPPPENLPFLDDRYCRKLFPPVYDRQWKCPAFTGIRPPATDGWALAQPLQQVHVDTTVLERVPELYAVNFAAVAVKRTDAGEVFYRYFGGPNYTEPFETWSSSKIFAMANAAVTLERDCDAALGGLSALTRGRLGLTPLGDLATIICSVRLYTAWHSLR